MKRYGLFYLRGHDGEMEENEDGEYVLYEDVAELQRQNYVLTEKVTSLDASARDLLAHRDAKVADLQRQLAEAHAQHDRLLDAAEKLIAVHRNPK